MRKSILASILVLLAAVSCQQQAPHGRNAVPLVWDIVSGSDAASAAIILEHGAPKASGEIFLAGSPQYTNRLAGKFLECDIAENARGRGWSDGLKDFAGETFSCINDGTFSPYSQFKSNPDSLRELAVRYALAALDTKCNVSVYDLDGNASKSSAKMLVLSDPWLYGYGKFDIDTLFTLKSVNIPVISPQELMFDAIFEGDKKAFNAGIICDSSYLASGIYPEIFKASAAEHSIVGTKCFQGTGDLYEFLDSYILSGGVQPLDVILVDDLSADLDKMRDQLEAIYDFSKEESMKYGDYVTEDLKIISSCELTMERCYDILRERSLFTHKIAQPVSKHYKVSPRPWNEDMQFLLIPVENVQNKHITGRN